MNEVGVTFKIDHLWALNDLIRHESDQAKAWRYPPSSLELNEAVAEAILACEENNLLDYTLMLSRGDTFCIDFSVRRGMTSPAGNKIGKEILMLIFKARRSLAEGEQNTSQEPARKDVDALMAKWKAKNANNDAGNDSDNQPD